MQIKNLIVLLFCSFILVACIPKINKVDKIDESKISDELKSLKLTNDKNELSINWWESFHDVQLNSIIPDYAIEKVHS